MPLRALARVNLAAIERNAARLRSGLAEGAVLCAVVKADASGHGAVPVARAALAGGATMLAVATAGEATEIRDAGLEAPLLVLGALSDAELPAALAARAEVVAWSPEFISALTRAGAPSAVRVHVKLDSGMGRLGTRDAAAALALAERIMAEPGLTLAGAMTHYATADDDPEFMATQLAAFRPFAATLRERSPGIVIHSANSAATLRDPATHLDLVRCGIALYGCDPMNLDPDPYGLEPALELTSYVAAVKLARAGESAGYGRRFVAERDTWIGTLPIGYADGIRRAYTNNLDVLIEGRRYPLVGTVSMDNVTVALGEEPGRAVGARPQVGVGERPEVGVGERPEVAVGARATIIGRDGDQRQTVEDLANRIDTIAHEVLCAISRRVPREYHRDGSPVP
jgi:alanine racemase